MVETPKKLNFTIKSNLNNNYSFDLYSNSNSYLQIDSNSINKVPNLTYEDSFSLENIKTLSKYFSLCDSISDVLISLEPNI